MRNGEKLGRVFIETNYSKKELKDLTWRIKKFLGQGKDVFIYFNNDASAFTVENARQLM